MVKTGNCERESEPEKRRKWEMKSGEKAARKAENAGKATGLCVFYAFYAHAPSLQSNRRWETGNSSGLSEPNQLNQPSHDNCIDIRDSTGKAEAAEIMRYYAKSQFACRMGKNLVCRPGQKPRRA